MPRRVTWASLLNDVAAFFGAGGGRRGRSRIVRLVVELDAAAQPDIEAVGAARADHQHRARGHGDRRIGAHRFARTQARQDHRRTRGILRRRDPGIDAIIRRRHHALPVEGRGHAARTIAAGGKEGRHQKHDHQRAQRDRIARGKARHRPAGAELAGGGERTLDMRAPQRLRHGVAFAGGELVGERDGGAMLQAAALVETAQAVCGIRHADDDEGRQRGERQQPEKDDADGAPERRQPQPKPKPGQHQEQAADRGESRQRRPDPFPQDTVTRPGDAPRQQRIDLSLYGNTRIFRVLARPFGQSVGPPGICAIAQA